jgi:asparaginyl-tRNA synthetase
MHEVSLDKISQFVNQEVLIRGWVYNFRSSGSIYFLQIRDGTDFLQAVVVRNSVDKESWENCQNLTLESSVEIKGIVSKHPKREEYEIQVKNLKIIQRAESYPLGKKSHGPDFLLDYRHLWLRSPSQWAIQRIRYAVINATYDFFRIHGFVKIDAPILTPTSCEGTTELFEMNYFDWTTAYLSQSGQLYLEAAIFAHRKVFDFGPVFRAEKSKTRRHLTEFWMMDAEMAFFSHEENMKLQEELISYLVTEVLKNNQKELEILKRNLEPLRKVTPPFYRLTHAEAIKLLQKAGCKVKEDDDLGGDEETIISQKYDKPVFIEKYPAKVKAFYMKRDPENPNLVLNDDLLAPEGYGEIIGGSEREDNYEKLLARMQELKMPLEPFQWYLDLRKYGSVPHSGFGYGLERIVAWICGIHHIREAIPFPRTINRLGP